MFCCNVSTRAGTGDSNIYDVSFRFFFFLLFIFCLGISTFYFIAFSLDSLLAMAILCLIFQLYMFICLFVCLFICFFSFSFLFRCMFVQFVMSTLIRVCFEMRFNYLKLGKVFFFFCRYRVM